MDHTIWLAVVDDAPDIARLQIDFDNEFDAHPPTEPVLTARYRRLLADRDGFVALTGSPSDLLGFATVTLRPTIYCDGPLAVLDELYVVPGRRDQGIGTALLRHVLAEVRTRGGGEMHINVDEIDTDTRRFYERHGFYNVEPGTDYRMLCYIGSAESASSNGSAATSVWKK